MTVSNLQQQLRNGRAISVVGLVCTFALVSAASRNQRALFPTEPFGQSASAFTAMPDSHTLIVGGGPMHERPGYVVSGARHSPLADGPFAVGPGGETLFPGFVPGAPGDGPQLSSVDGASPLEGFPDADLAGVGGLPSATLPGDGVPGDGSAPTPAVPEPSTWLMATLGLSVIGWAVRRRTATRKRGSNRSSAIAGDSISRAVAN